ncbi:MAG TPA: hypothetical protein P5110_07565 [Candidatus Omnitrophota bacterium]|nr:hypothetical protein [Candidatus Omnitrophota bacterium]
MFKKVIKLDKHDGGLNTKYNVRTIAINESPDLLNVVFDDVGAVETRKGYTHLNTAAIATAVVDGLYSYVHNDTATMVAACNGSLFTLDGAATFVTIPSAQSIYTAGAKVEMYTYLNDLYLCNGADGIIPYKYNGTDFTRMGSYAPVSACVASAGCAGALSGTYGYKVVYLNSNLVESNPSSSVTVVLAAERGSLTGIPVAPQSWGINARNIYRTAAGGSQYLYAFQIANNTATAATDNVADADLLTTAPIDNYTPPKCTKMIQHKDRMFFMTDDLLYYSNVGDAELVGNLDFINVCRGSGYTMRNMEILGDSLVLYLWNDATQQGQIYVLYMTDATTTNWYLKKSDSPYGCVSSRAVVPFGDGLHGFLDKQGFLQFGGKDVLPSASFLTIASIRSAFISDKIEPTIFSMNAGYLKNTAGILYKNKIWWALPYSSSTYNNRVLQYDFLRRDTSKQMGAWSLFSGMNFSCFAIHNGSLYAGSATANGTVYVLETGYNDDGAAINSYYKTKFLPGETGKLEAYGVHRVFRKLFLLLGLSGDWEIKVRTKNDFDAGTGNEQMIDVNPGGSLWGTMVWGVDTWGGGNTIKTERIDLPGSRGTDIQIEYTNNNTKDQYFKIHTAEVHYNEGEYARGR